ncbi:MAG: alpha/beta hydrolase [Acidimicrobiales bacterium]
MLHPALEPYVRGVQSNPGPPLKTQTMSERRDAYLELAQAIRGDDELAVATTDLTARLETGRSLSTRLYVPANDEDKALVLYFHGGSFVVGGLETHDALCRRLSADTGMRFLAVDYRLAPEHPFPAAINDAVDMFRHVVAHWSDYAAPDAEMIVMGDSAGASLVAVAAALTKNEHLGIAAQVLIYPTLGPELVTESAHKYGVGYMLDLENLRHDYAQYLGDFVDHTDPRVTPLMFEDLAGAPPAILLVAECDPLRDEGLAYAGLLEHFGVDVEILEAEGMVHGFLRLGGLVPETLEIVEDLAEHMHHLVEHASA